MGSNTAYKESGGGPWIALMDDETVADAYQRTIDKYNYWIAVLLGQGNSGTASHLKWNRDHFISLGEQNAKLLVNEVIDDTETLISILNLGETNVNIGKHNQQ